MPQKIVKEELELLNQVNSLLDAQPTESGPSEVSLVAELERLREMMNDGVKTEDQPALIQQWDRQSALLQQLRAARQAPQVDVESPYFAHLRLRENKQERDILIGKATRLQRGVRIVDWRNAPISKIFYRYQQGDDYEEEIAGRTMSGEVVARRTVTIRSKKMQRIDAPEGIFTADSNAPDGWRETQKEASRLAGGQGAALRAHPSGEGTARRLGTDMEGTRRRVDKHLPDIAGLIDPTQFDLITRPGTGFLVVRGTAGSGKTTVALHRIAYLAFEDPSVDSSQTMVVVFSRALRDYVGHVLPALGVHHVQVRTFFEWATEQSKRMLPKMPRTLRQSTPGVVHRLKLHPALLIALERYIQRTPGRKTPAQVIDDWASVLTSAPLLEEIFSELAPDAFTTDELVRATSHNRDQARAVLSWVEGDLSSEAEIDAEDDAILLRAWQLRIGPLLGPGERPVRYKHIAIDEVQDFAPMEVQVLLDCLTEERSITLAGDTQQHVVQNGGFTSWSDFFKHLGLRGTEVSTLEISYRCSREIAEFAVALLGDLREDQAPPTTTRSGPPVEFFRFTDHGACVAFLGDALKDLVAKEPYASIVLLTPNGDVSGLYFRGLQTSDVPRLHHVEDQDFTFAPGIEITEIDQVKGLEFDYVVLVEASSSHFPDNPAARRLLHVGATRAVHQLWVTSVGTPSPIIRPLISAPA